VSSGTNTGIQSVFILLLCDAMLARYMLFSCVWVYVSHAGIKIAKHRIMQIKPQPSWALVFWCQRFEQNLNGCPKRATDACWVG